MNARHAEHPATDLALHRSIEELLVAYAHCLDDDRLEEWPDFFDDECRYVIHPRENYAAKLEGYWLYFDSKPMLRDRVLSLRKANLYNIHQDRRIVGNIALTGVADGVHDVRSSYIMVQTDVEGRGRLFSAGEYRDRIVFTARGARFRERIVIPDNHNLEGLIAVPI